MKMRVLGAVLCLTLVSFSAQAGKRKIAAADWTPAVGDDVKYSIYEEQQSGNGVSTGTLEKQITKVSGGLITLQITTTITPYGGKDATTTKEVVVSSEELGSGSIMVHDCKQPTTIPVSIQTDGAGTFDACMMSPDQGKDIDGDPAAFTTFLGLVPFSTVRQDSVKASNGNHVRLLLKQITLGSAK